MEIDGNGGSQDDQSNSGQSREQQRHCVLERYTAAGWLDTDTVADETWQTTATLNNPAFLPQLFTLSQTEKHLALITVMY